MKIGYIGLGRMGKNMVLRLLEQGIEIVAWNRSSEPREEVAKAGAIAVESIDELISKLKPPRIIWVMLTAGQPTHEILEVLSQKAASGDLIIDGGNSFYKDTLSHSKMFHDQGISFMDVGTSGGPAGARNGACLMIGGAKEDYEKILEIAKAAASPGAYQHVGDVGAGHFVKMIHNGIEYGMMEAIGEGFAILKNSEFNVDLHKAADIYQHRSVIESRLVGWLKEALDEDPNLTDTSSKIGATGEGEWTINTAKEMGIEIPVIEDSFKVRQQSEHVDENSSEGFRNKAVSAMRGKFGQHAVKK